MNVSLSATTKKITSITLKNYRGYYGSYGSIEIPEGQNLLIYGENGSGKSSLFKAINNYLVSSRNTALPFVKNRHSLHEDGEIRIDFSDFDDGTSKVISNSAQSFSYGSINSTNNVNFIQDTALIKGFLDYTDLLNVYFHSDPQPNLFDLIVLKLLGNHAPVRSGGNFTFRNKWEQLQEDLTTNAYTRNDRCHQWALAELPVFQIHLRATLNEIFDKLNFLLRTYFVDLGIELAYILKNFEFNYRGGKWDWYTTADLRLNVIKDGVLIPGDYGDVLNEARMSAFAISLYLASLKCNPSRLPFKILYLDDIFIGLDSGNRLPILNIIINEFADYQVFISTYDRYTYEVAKRHFEGNVNNKWMNLELYVTRQTIGSITFDKPLLISNVDEFRNAVYYLHHAVKPDYPASANYFRKYAENILLDNLPTHEIKNQDYETIENFKLNELVNAGIKFLTKIGAPTQLLVRLKSCLPTILHPLSHFNLASPIYKNELIEVQQILFELCEFLINLKNYYRKFLEQSRILKIKFNISATEVGYYEIFISEMTYLLNNTAGLPSLSSGKCRLKSTYTILNDIKSEAIIFNKNDMQFHYLSLEDAYSKIFDYVSGLPQFNTLIKAQNYATEYEMDMDGNWTILDTVLIWE